MVVSELCPVGFFIIEIRMAGEETDFPGDSRDVALIKELEQLKRINKSIGDALGAVQTVKNNVIRLKDASNVSHGLLDQWASILSQASFTRQVLEEPQWYGGADNSLSQNEQALSVNLDREQELLRELQLLESKNVVTRKEIERRLGKRSIPEETLQANKRRFTPRTAMSATNTRTVRK